MNESLSQHFQKSDPNHFKLALANFMDGTDKRCGICNHKYVDVDDCIKRKIYLIKLLAKKSWMYEVFGCEKFKESMTVDRLCFL